MSQEISVMSRDERILRKLVWLNHGCAFSTLYGDDGEMQCGDCAIDFLRMSPEDIQERLVDLKMKRYMANEHPHVGS